MIQLLVAEDQELLRGALVEVFLREPDLEVVAQCGLVSEIIPLAREVEPDLAVLDIEYPDGSSLDVIDDLLEQVPGVRILMLTVFGRPGYLRRSLDNGAVSFVLKDTRPVDLVDAIRRTAAGQRVVDPELAVAALSSGDSPLTPREAEVLAASRDFAGTAELAAAVHLSTGSVRNLLSSAMQKLQATTRGEAARRAERSGWL